MDISWGIVVGIFTIVGGIPGIMYFIEKIKGPRVLLANSKYAETNTILKKYNEKGLLRWCLESKVPSMLETKSWGYAYTRKIPLFRKIIKIEDSNMILLKRKK